MKKILLSLIVLMAGMSINAQVIRVYKNGTLEAFYANNTKDTYKVVFGEATTGEAAVSSTAGVPDNKVAWVQLWENGPKFATMNVGATRSDLENCATYYDTKNKIGDEVFTGGYYSWGGSASRDYNYNTGSVVLSGDYDTATKVWGSKWRMPTRAEMESLCAGVTLHADDNNQPVGSGEGIYTKWTWCDGTTTQYVEGCTIAGFKVEGVQMGYTGNSIFLPAAGQTSSSSAPENVYYDGKYWTSTPYESGTAHILWFYKEIGFDDIDGNVTPLYNGGIRSRGYSVRAVLRQ